MINYESSIDETDKFRKNNRPDYPGHNYQLLYHNFFISNPQKILEIGTSSCGFAKFLKDNNIGKYIVGADLRKDIVSGHIPSNLTWSHLFDDFYEGDAMSEDFLFWIKNKEYKFDLVIDDASHKVDMQKYLISKCDFFMSDDSVYITEDITSYENAVDILKSVPEQYRTYSYIFDARYSCGRYDDLCVIIDYRKL